MNSRLYLGPCLTSKPAHWMPQATAAKAVPIKAQGHKN